MPSPLARPIGMPAIELLRDERRHIRQGGEQRNLKIASAREAFKNCWQPEGDAVAPGHRAEVTQRQQNYIAMAQSFPNAVGMNTLLGFLFALQYAGDPGSLIGWKPSGLFGPVRQLENGDDSEQHRRNPLDNEQPSPSAESKP